MVLCYVSPYPQNVRVDLLTQIASTNCLISFLEADTTYQCQGKKLSRMSKKHKRMTSCKEFYVIKCTVIRVIYALYTLQIKSFYIRKTFLLFLELGTTTTSFLVYWHYL